MSWQAAVLVLLGVTLFAGFAWYERSRPSSQVIALVAALAALAAAGRVALSPIPNVVPTTDIALISGFALGTAPGFAVGALAGLVSNFWLGQGPWTPWQMAGWGLAGVLGALLAYATARRVGRIGLAAACGVAAIAYGALLDLSLMVTYGGEQSLDRFLAISARGIPFNVAHALGNIALALVAGPALVRMLSRYRERFEFAWRAPRAPAAARGGAAGLVGLLVAGLIATGLAGGQQASAAKGKGPAAGTAWLRAAQNADGGFGTEPGSPSNAGMTGWAVMGLEAAGINPLELRKGSRTPISYLRKRVGQIRLTGDLERTILALEAAGVNPRKFRGRNLVARLAKRRGGNGSWGDQVNTTAFGVLALDAAGATGGNRRSTHWLAQIRNDDGGWGFAPGASSDADTTGAVLQALAAGGGPRGAINAGVAYLRGSQRKGGGFALSGGPVNAQSTAWVTQGLIAAGVSPRSVRRGGRSPLDYLASVQAGDGHYRYSKSLDQTPVWVTGQVLQAVSGKALPLAEVARPTAKGKGGASAGKPGPPVASGGGSVVGGGTGFGIGDGSGGGGTAPGGAPPAAKDKPTGPAAGGDATPAVPPLPPIASPEAQAALEELFETEGEEPDQPGEGDSGSAVSDPLGSPLGSGALPGAALAAATGGEDESGLPAILAACFAALVAAGGAWMLRRGRHG